MRTSCLMMTFAVLFSPFYATAIELTAADMAPQRLIKFDRPAIANNGMASVDKSKGISFTEDPSSSMWYLNDSQRQSYRVIIKDCTVFAVDSRKLAQMNMLGPDGKTVTSMGHKDDHVQYVMDQAGNFYLFDEHLNHHVHHSSILSGGPVAGAGEIKIGTDGRIHDVNRDVDSNSGHYSAGGLLLHNVQKELETTEHGCGNR